MEEWNLSIDPDGCVTAVNELESPLMNKIIDLLAIDNLDDLTVIKIQRLIAAEMARLTSEMGKSHINGERIRALRELGRQVNTLKA
jgi:hypothetical protein